MKKSQSLISFNTRLEEDLYTKLKILAARTNTTIQDLVNNFIKEGLSKESK